MELEPTHIEGLYVVHIDRFEDERGTFARAFDRGALEQAGLSLRPDYVSASFNPAPWTLRGMHYQAEPHGESKLIRCTRGAIFDVLIDLREHSPTRGDHLARRMGGEEAVALFAPPGLAHGFLTLEAGSEVEYVIEGAFTPSAARGVRWDDPAFSIVWPHPPDVIAPRDAGWEDWQDGIRRNAS